MRVLVVGLAATGASVVSYTRAAGHQVTVLEDHPPRSDAAAHGYAARAARAVAEGAVLVESPDAVTAAEHGRAADLVVPSPGVRPDHPALVAAHSAGVPIRSEIDLAAARLRARADAPRLVAVTGTNGKTTVTTLIDAMLHAAGVPSVAAGNIGRPLLDAAGDDVAVVVAEVSSFQLAHTTTAFAPDVAVLLNVAEDHLDWHGSTDAYADAKARVFAHQSPDALLVVNGDDPVANRLAAAAPGRVVRFGLAAPQVGMAGVRDGQLVGPTGSVLAPVPGSGAPHDSANALAAAVVALEVGADGAAVAHALAGFGGLAHRVQLVGERGGVRYYDDSKATNPHATAGALGGFEHVVLIAGGRNKALDLGGLRAHAGRLRAVVAIGEAAGEVEAAFAGAVPVVRAESMHDAVRAAADAARPDDAVLLSPACASFDWYESYAARGDDFAREVGLLGASTSCRNGESPQLTNGEPV
ncbi:MAG TPA: UDP-N-acetylmuramoyl-L-alanine--D-glutamate ligase [Solirubrobacteraceae bacterium]